jgi:hypothetical protein
MQHKYKQSWLFQDTQGGQGKYSHNYCHRHFAIESKPKSVSLVPLFENLGPNAIKQISVTSMQHKYKQSWPFHYTQGGHVKYSHNYCHRHFANESKPEGVSLATLSENLAQML